MMDARSGAQRIADERARQIAKHRWSAAHDDEQTDDELAWAAVCYAAPDNVYVRREDTRFCAYYDPWPWSEEQDKSLKNPTTAERIRQLEKAGSLIAAEIDRLLRTGGCVS